MESFFRIALQLHVYHYHLQNEALPLHSHHNANIFTRINVISADNIILYAITNCEV